ncbi:hypothetical protein KS4_32390 [Poriferisphaera corsica]|uniref:YcxB-like protein domain-containing protein n=1 Tax=Poriferisphaera corsica TaxID=2528020 RepID=A0A517YY79_9BACT|nr:hypothetical protein [Poriferisphaera corsica]QDU35159.1 hypothetical protein KS4_32390 [Poriferisphaera corsica]
MSDTDSNTSQAKNMLETGDSEFAQPDPETHTWDWESAPVQTHGQYKVDDYKQLHKIITDQESSFWSNIFAVIVLLLVSLYPMLWCIRELIDQQTNMAEILASIGIIFTPLFLVFLLYNRVLSKTWSKRKSQLTNSRLVHIPSAVIIDEDAIAWYDDRIYIRLIWSAFSNIYFRKDIIYFRSADDFIVLPRRFFASNDDWLNFRLKLYREIRDCAKCEYDLTGSESLTCPECGDHLLDQIEKQSTQQ